MASHLKIWETDNYYQKAAKGSANLKHPGMKLLLKLSRNAKSILDLGCGEGTRLNLVAKDKDGWGIDISQMAIKKARTQFPDLHFVRANLQKIPISDARFDLIYCAFVLEHLENPELVISEALRVLKKGGALVLIAPNYGSPNRASPNFRGNRFVKFVLGVVSNLLYDIRISSNTLQWKRVIPDDLPGKYESDRDCLIEPNADTLYHYLKYKHLRVEYFDGCWSEEMKGASVMQIIIKFIGRMGLYPFKFWGPHFVMLINK